MRSPGTATRESLCAATKTQRSQKTTTTTERHNTHLPTGYLLSLRFAKSPEKLMKGARLRARLLMASRVKEASQKRDVGPALER